MFPNKARKLDAFGTPSGTPSAAATRPSSAAPSGAPSSAPSVAPSASGSSGAPQANLSSEDGNLVAEALLIESLELDLDLGLEEIAPTDMLSAVRTARTPSGRMLPVLDADVAEARGYLRTRGRLRFLERYLPEQASLEDIMRLIMLLGHYPPDLSTDETIVSALRGLSELMDWVSSRRQINFHGPGALKQAIESIEKSKRIIVLTGAGISTLLGIPDFRSSKGLYLKLAALNLLDPQEVFDLNTFREDPSIFYQIAHMVLPPEHRYTPLHAFIQLLDARGKLLRNYTQNIDNLEQVAGISPERVIQCHGSFAGATCHTCRYQVRGDLIFPEIRRKELALCPKCAPKRRKMEASGALDSQPAFGVMKPDITFFGESLPDKFHNYVGNDVRECDLLICIGTSLKVAPVNEIVQLVPDSVPQILINKDYVRHCEFDVSVLGYCDQAAVYLCKELGWRLNHEDFDKILNSGLEAELIDEDSRTYEVTDAAQRQKEAEDALKEEFDRQQQAKDPSRKSILVGNGEQIEVGDSSESEVELAGSEKSSD